MHVTEQFDHVLTSHRHKAHSGDPGAQVASRAWFKLLPNHLDDLRTTSCLCHEALRITLGG